MRNDLSLRVGVLVLAIVAVGGPAAAMEPVGDAEWALQIEERVVAYPVHGRDLNELRKQIRGAGGHGRTSSEFGLTYVLQQEEGACLIDDAPEIRVEITVTLPQWAPPEGVSGELREEWEVALAALERHEAGHRQHARAAAAALHGELMQLAPEADCKRLRLGIARTLQRITWKLELQASRYDARTRNGLRDDLTAGLPDAGRLAERDATK